MRPPSQPQDADGQVARGVTDIGGYRRHDDPVRLRLGGHLRGNRGQHRLEGVQVIDAERHAGVVAPVHGHQVSDVRGTRRAAARSSLPFSQRPTSWTAWVITIFGTWSSRSRNWTYPIRV